MSKQTIAITNGPSREDLFDGLKLHAEKRFIPFGITRAGEEPRKKGEESFLVTLIQSIQAEDGSGESWNITLCISKIHLTNALNPPKPKVETAVVSKQVTFSCIKAWIQQERTTGERDYVVQACTPKVNYFIVKAYYSTKTRTGVITVE